MTPMLILTSLGLSLAPAAPVAVGPLFPITAAPEAPVATPASEGPVAPSEAPVVPVASSEAPAAPVAGAPVTAEPAAPVVAPSTGASANQPLLTDPFSHVSAAAPPPPSAPARPVAVVRETDPRPARPILTRFDLQLDLATNRVNDGSFLAFNDEPSLLGPGVRLRGDVRLGKGPLFVGGGLSYHYFATDRTVLGNLSNRIVLHEARVHGRVSLVAIEGIDLFADLSAGPSFAAYTVNVSEGAEGTGKKTIGTFAALGGFSLYLPKKWLVRKQASRVTAGLETAFGYQYRASIDVEPRLEAQENPIDITTTRFGDVALRGFSWQLGLFLRFL